MKMIKMIQDVKDEDVHQEEESHNIEPGRDEMEQLNDAYVNQCYNNCRQIIKIIVSFYGGHQFTTNNRKH